MDMRLSLKGSPQGSRFRVESMAFGWDQKLLMQTLAFGNMTTQDGRVGHRYTLAFNLIRVLNWRIANLCIAIVRAEPCRAMSSITKRFVFRLSTAAQAKGGLFWFNVRSNRVLQVWDPLRNQRSIFHGFDYGHYSPTITYNFLRSTPFHTRLIRVRGAV